MHHTEQRHIHCTYLASCDILANSLEQIDRNTVADFEIGTLSGLCVSACRTLRCWWRPRSADGTCSSLGSSGRARFGPADLRRTCILGRCAPHTSAATKNKHVNITNSNLKQNLKKIMQFGKWKIKSESLQLLEGFVCSGCWRFRRLISASGSCGNRCRGCCSAAGCRARPRRTAAPAARSARHQPAKLNRRFSPTIPNFSSRNKIPWFFWWLLPVG